MTNVQRTLTFPCNGEVLHFIDALVQSGVSFSFGSIPGREYVSVSFDGTEEDYGVFMQCAHATNKASWGTPDAGTTRVCEQCGLYAIECLGACNPV